MYILNTNCKVWYAATMNPEEIYGLRCLTKLCSRGLFSCCLVSTKTKDQGLSHPQQVKLNHKPIVTATNNLLLPSHNFTSPDCTEHSRDIPG